MQNTRRIYGRHPVSEALRARPAQVQKIFIASGKDVKADDILKLARRHGIAVSTLARKQIDELVGEVAHQGIVAEVESFQYSEIDELVAKAKAKGEEPLLLALDQIQDPHNLGAILRSAYALGAHGVILPKDHACEINGTVVKSSAGAAAHLPVVRVTNLHRALEELKEKNLWIAGAVAESRDNLQKLDLVRPTVIVVGSEGKGIRRLIAETCDVLVAIPMAGELGSLNASVAAAIFLYEAARQRNEV